MNISEEIIKELIERSSKTLEDLNKVKRFISKRYKAPCPTNMSILKNYHELVKKRKIKKNERIQLILRTRPIRSLSGIVNISVLTKTYDCPGKCIFCPTEKNLPKSYLSGEPAVERAKKLKFDPYLQVQKRIEMLNNEGHPTDKVELRTIGGTWSYYPKTYRNWFIKRCFEACNKKTSKNLKEAQKLNETAKHRIVGLSIETRPDFINQKEIKHLRELGVTMVELGIQSIYDDVLKLNSRGHDRKTIISATKILKDYGFKILYQMMPNLMGSSLKRDKETFKELFSNQDFQPDFLKIYPCALIKGTDLYKLYKKKKYKPYGEKQLISLVKDIKKIIPPYIRIQRITRDIPSHSIVLGPARITNLRQILTNDMKISNWKCKCIRCREIREKYDPKEKLYLFRDNYKASNGNEIFLTFENKGKDKLYSLLRLRITENNEAFIREVHTFGQLQPIDSMKERSPQHKGLGKKLTEEAERIAKKEYGAKKITVISGVGVRGYYRKIGYKLKNTYMLKNLS
ncbi:MAG: tRNA uridine(34) 5-carboxymethylaminomethyl modification radical SAM/GNAT enzyme Elp3 [Candidatus Nealsonbacteria bacterium]